MAQLQQTKSISITPLESAHYAQWLIHWNAYLAFYKTELPKAISDNTWKNILNKDVPIYGFGAFQEDNMVGFVHTVLHPNTWNDTEVCYLEDLFVSESVRGGGVGRALIEYVYGFATAKHCNRVYWVTNEGNTTARKLYDNLATMTDMVQYRHDL